MKLKPEDIYSKKRKGEKITALTAYDFPTARILDEAGVDIIMVGDSLGMVLLGHANTRGVTLKDILYHTRPVSKATKRALVVADMPYQSYRTPEEALQNAEELVKDAKADAVKLEGGASIEPQVRKLVMRGVPVMGHVGMLPQSIGNGKFRVYGKTNEEAEAILKDAKLLDRLGVFAIVLECMPAKLAKRITAAVKCPTIGIGAGAGTDGQILVLHDMLGIRTAVSPRFVRRYATIEAGIRKAVQKYCKDVAKKRFPSAKESF
jgi:3-methyl-2-oxobutanoate hydroxymethyltransferase